MFMQIRIKGESSGGSEDCEPKAMVFGGQENGPDPQPNKNGVGMRGHLTELHQNYIDPSDASERIVVGAKENEDCKKLGTESEQNLEIGNKYEESEVASIIYRCPACPFETKLRHSFTHHVNFHRNPELTEAFKESVTSIEGHKGYRCEVCQFVTKVRSGMKKHLLSVSHAVNSQACQKGAELDTLRVHTYCCHFCSFQTHCKVLIRTHEESHKDSSEKLKDHKMQDLSAQRIKFKCSECSFDTVTPCDIHGHIKTHRVWRKACKATVYRCQACEYWSDKVGDIRRHILGHTDLGGSVTVVFEGRPEFRCDKCPFRSIFRRVLKIHQRKSCQNAGKRPNKQKQKLGNASQKGKTQGHSSSLPGALKQLVTEKTVRTGKRPKKQKQKVGNAGQKDKTRGHSSSLPGADKQLFTEKTLRTATDHDGSYPQILQCEDCPCRFVSEHVLMKHVKSKHMNTTNWLMCDLCAYVTKRPDQMSAHVAMAHSSDTPELRCDPVQSSEKIPVGALWCPEKNLISPLQCTEKNESQMVKIPDMDFSVAFQCPKNDKMVWCPEKNVIGPSQCTKKDKSQMRASPGKGDSCAYQCPKNDERRMVWCPENSLFGTLQCPKKDESKMVRSPEKSESSTVQCSKKNKKHMVGCLKQDESRMVRRPEKEVTGAVRCSKNNGASVGPVPVLSQIEMSVGMMESIEIKNNQNHRKRSTLPHGDEDFERKGKLMKHKEEPECIDLTDEKEELEIKNEPIDPGESDDVHLLAENMSTSQPTSDTANVPGKDQTQCSVQSKAQVVPDGSITTQQLVLHPGTISGKTTPAKAVPQERRWLQAATQKKPLKRLNDKSTRKTRFQEIEPLHTATSNKPSERPSEKSAAKTWMGSFQQFLQSQAAI